MIVVVALGGCSEWPRYSHLAANDGALPATVDLSSLVEVDWNTQQETPGADNDLPTGSGVRQETLAQSQGHVFDATLEGTGWGCGIVPESIESASCAGTVGKRTSLDKGDYDGDVDFLIIVQPDVDGTLCGRAQVQAVTSGNDPEAAISGFGWDLGLLEVDSCGIPIAVVFGDDEGTFNSCDGEVALPIGVNNGGATGGWGVPVTSDKRYALYFAGYHPKDEQSLVEYTASIALVGSEVDGTAGVCPPMPEDL